MKNITTKKNTLRSAIAEARVVVSAEQTIISVRENQVPKGNIFEMARAAGLLGIKQTPHLIPDCHPIPIESAEFTFDLNALQILVRCSVSTIYKTGVEVEAMHGASIAALTMYDMLKPIDKAVEISAIRLIEKKGGKSDFHDKFLDRRDLKAAVVVCSDTISAGKKEDQAGKAIVAKLAESKVTVGLYEVIPDDPAAIKAKVDHCKGKFDLLIFTGGTGLSSRDVTPETLIPLIERRIPGMEEAIRNYGQNRMPYSMLSRSVAGLIGKMLVLALPGSTNGAKESMDAIFPEALHIFGIIGGKRHD